MNREKQDSAYDMLGFRVVHVLDNCLLRVMPPVEQHGKRRSVRIPSQADREPRAPSKILRALSVVALVASFLRGFASRERPATQAIPKWPHAGFIYAAWSFRPNL
jgi:hypothetical protein